MVETVFTDKNGIFIDRSPKYFEHILDYLRSLNTNEPFEPPKHRDIRERLFHEADYYKLEDLKDLLTQFPLSAILSAKESRELVELCKFSRFDQWELVYRGSEHGFGADDFHSRCDFVQKTLVIVKTGGGFVFGGYTESAWDQSDSFKRDFKSFLFSFRNADGIKLKLVDKNIGIHCKANRGPIFSFSDGYKYYDYRYFPLGFEISDGSNANLESLSYLETVSYKDSVLSDKFLTGSNYFQVEEIEVYKRVD